MLCIFKSANLRLVEVSRHSWHWTKPPRAYSKHIGNTTVYTRHKKIQWFYWAIGSVVEHFPLWHFQSREYFSDTSSVLYLTSIIYTIYILREHSSSDRDMSSFTISENVMWMYTFSPLPKALVLAVIGLWSSLIGDWPTARLDHPSTLALSDSSTESPPGRSRQKTRTSCFLIGCCS